MSRLFTKHAAVLGVAYAEMKRHALEQPVVLMGTPGSLTTRTVSGRAYLHRQYYDANGTKRSDYLGAADDRAVVARADVIREQIALAATLQHDARILAAQGYVRADARSGAIVAACANYGLFRAGALLVGSHAFGVLVNDAGLRSSAFVTEDVDIARGERLDLPEGSPSFETILATSHIELFGVPQLDHRKPSTSWRPRGKDRLRVALLVPTRGTEIGIRPIPELGAHATGVPFLGYLLEGGNESVLIARDVVVPVSVPSPERFVWHKALVSQMRRVTSEKREKDLVQAAVIAASVAELAPGSLSDAFRDVPRSARRATRAGAAAMRAKLDDAGDERAVDAIDEALGA